MSRTLFDAVQEPLKAVVAELLRSKGAEKVTYKRYTGQAAFDKSVGFATNTYDEIPLYAFRMRHNQNSVKVSTSDVQVGDLLFLFSGASFPTDTSLKDVVVDAAGNELGIKGIDPIFSIAVSVTIAGAK